MEAINIKAYTKSDSQVNAIKAFLKALKIKFETTESTSSNPEFIKKIKFSEEQIVKGKVTKLKLDEIDNFIASI